MHSASPRQVTIVLLAAALAWSVPGAATAEVFWGNTQGNSIGRANTGGETPNQSFVTQAKQPMGVVTDGTYVYWTNYAVGAIGRAKLDGTDANHAFITGASAPYGLAADGTHLYWANSGTKRIGRARLDGTQIDQAFVSVGTNVFWVAVNRSHLFWSTGQLNSIGRANIDGTGIDSKFITGATTPVGVTLDGTSIYWANFDKDTIGRANLDGSGVNQAFVTGADDPVGVDVTASHVYWANRNTNTLGRARIDGTDVRRSFVTGANSPGGVTVTLPQSIAFRAPADRPVNTGPVPLRASASSGLPIRSRSTTPAVCRVSNGAAFLLRSGTCSITAEQDGSSDFLAAAAVSRSFQVLRKLTVRVRARSRGSKLFVDVNPSLVSRHWRFVVQVRKRGAWRTLDRHFRTKGSKEIRTVNLKKGRYRVVIKTGPGRVITSAAVHLKR